LQIILDLKQIARRYLSGFFIVDLIINLPFFYGFYLSKDIDRLHFIKLCTLFRLFRTSTFLIYCHRALKRFHVGDKYLDISKILVYWLVGIHWTACLHLIPGLILSRFNISVKVNAWYEYSDYIARDNFTKYAILVFMSIKTVMGMGSVHDLQPRESFDKIYSIILTIVGRIGLFFTFAYIWVMLQGMMSSKLRYDEMMVQINKYTSCHHLPPTTRIKLKNNYDYRFRKRYFNEREILRTISWPLRQQIMIHNTQQLVENSPFFENLPSHLIMRIIASLSIELYLKDDIIYSVGEIGTSVHFITSGSVAFYSSSGKEIVHFTDGDYFGEITFVSDVNYRFCKAVALETTECYK
jgi:Cyclic nucleotide-binding domain